MPKNSDLDRRRASLQSSRAAADSARSRVSQVDDQLTATAAQIPRTPRPATSAVRLPATRMQPLAAADATRDVAAVAVTGPLAETRDIAGPEVFPLDQLGRITLAARGDDRPVVTDAGAGIFAAARGTALIAGAGTLLTETTLRQWLAG